MKRVLILGANGQIVRLVIPRLLQETDVHLPLYLRKSARLQSLESERVDVLEGDVNDFAALTKAMKILSMPISVDSLSLWQQILLKQWKKIKFLV